MYCVQLPVAGLSGSGFVVPTCPVVVDQASRHVTLNGMPPEANGNLILRRVGEQADRIARVGFSHPY